MTICGCKVKVTSPGATVIDIDYNTKLNLEKSELEIVQDIQFLDVLIRLGQMSALPDPGDSNTCLQFISRTFPVVSASVRLHRVTHLIPLQVISTPFV